MTTIPDALAITLELAVPLWIDRLRGRTPDQLVAIASRCATVVSSEGDNLMFRAHKRGATARVFNHLAEGLAALAYAPGGVTFAGKHWEVPTSPLHPDDMAEQLAELARLAKPLTTATTTGDLL